LLFALLVLLIAGGISTYLLVEDLGRKAPEQYYAWTYWYGVGSITAAVFGAILVLLLLMSQIPRAIKRTVAGVWSPCWRRSARAVCERRERCS
jgi:hypothetical protein